jgi:hypothetical protein
MGLSGLASLALLAAMAALGVGILRRLAPFLDAFEQWIYGSVLGTVLCSFLLFVLAIPLGLSRLLVLGLGAAAATTGALLLRSSDFQVASWRQGLRDLLSSRVGLLVLVVISGFVLRLAWTTFSLPALLFPSEIRATAAGFSAACAKVGATCGTLFLPMLTKAIGLQYTLAILAGLSGVAWLVTARLGAGLTTKKSPNHQDNCK